MEATGLHFAGGFELVVHEEAHALGVILVLLAEDELFEDAGDGCVLFFLLGGEIARACLILCEELADLFKSMFSLFDSLGALSLMNNDRLLGSLWLTLLLLLVCRWLLRLFASRCGGLIGGNLMILVVYRAIDRDFNLIEHNT